MTEMTHIIHLSTFWCLLNNNVCIICIGLEQTDHKMHFTILLFSDEQRVKHRQYSML